MGNLKQACSESEHHECNLDVPTEKCVKMTELSVMKGGGEKTKKKENFNFTYNVS